MNKIPITIDPASYEMKEEIRNLRTNLLFCGDDKRVLFVTSAIANEGKTEIVLRLAQSFTELQKKVLIIDIDFRKSVMMSRITSTPVENGLSHLLSGQKGLGDVICMTDMPGLHIIFAGPSVPNPTELLSGSRFGKMIDTLRERYDYIIIDTPPVGLVVDGLVIAKECDGAVIAMETGKIKRKFAAEVKRKIDNTKCPVLGVVLNKVDKKKATGYYGGYYRKRYGSYYKNDRETLKEE